MEVIKGKDGKPHLKWTKMDTAELIAAFVSSAIAAFLACWVMGVFK